MPSCSARGCNNKSGQRLKVTFHLFPKNNETRQHWIPVTGRKNWTPGKRAVLCSDHFEEPCFDRTGQTTRLRIGAVPTKGKFAPKNKKFQQQIFIKQEPDHEPTLTTPSEPSSKNGMTTRSGRQLSGRMAAVLAALKKDPSEEREIEETVERDVASSDLPSSTYPDHFYCRTSKEMESLLRKSESRVEFLKKKLDYLSTTPNAIVKTEPPPDWSKFNRASLQKEAEIIKASLKDGPPVADHTNTKDLLKKDEQLREKIKEAQEIKKQIKSAQQRNRRIKKRSKAKFFRYVVMIEPTKEGKKASATCTPIRNKNENGEEEGVVVEEEGEHDGEEKMVENEESIKEESQNTVNQVSSIHESILSHTASMILGPKDLSLNKNKEKQVKDLEKKLKIAKLKEKRKTEQIQHLYEVIDMLKERWPEYQTEKEHNSQRHCSLCHSSLLKRCNQIPDSWDISNVTENLTLPLMSPSPQSCHTVSKRPSPLGIGVNFCSNCRKWGKSNILSQRRSLVCKLRPDC